MMNPKKVYKLGIIDGIVKRSAGKARKYFGMRRTCRTPQWRGMQRNAASGLFTMPSRMTWRRC